jgi:hypothetical protein
MQEVSRYRTRRAITPRVLGGIRIENWRDFFTVREGAGESEALDG